MYSFYVAAFVISLLYPHIIKLQLE